jgi:hypothetical protein
MLQILFVHIFRGDHTQFICAAIKTGRYAVSCSSSFNWVEDAVHCSTVFMTITVFKYKCPNDIFLCYFCDLQIYVAGRLYSFNSTLLDENAATLIECHLRFNLNVFSTQCQCDTTCHTII